MLDRIFVYGTLRSTSHAPMAAEFARHAALIGTATIRGRRVDLGPYSGLVDAVGPDDIVDGEVWRLRAPAEYLPELDTYEGCGAGDPEPHEFRRVVRTATLDSGEPVEAWVYVYSRQPAG